MEYKNGDNMLGNKKLLISDLMSLQEYNDQHSKFISKVREHKKYRNVYIGEHVKLYFEDSLTMKHQIQEMIRIEKLTDANSIQHELNVYNSLIPDGDNLKATMMIIVKDVSQRKIMLSNFVGIERKVWLRSPNSERIFSIADEDLERTDDDRTSSVHFLRFQLSKEFINDIKKSANITIGINHSKYNVMGMISKAVVESITNDLN